ncbi:MAG: rRNA methyltransferase [Acidobacteria bacterium]|nr:MAG: rRNA methyltransferase [Acidobacteriota bacterium]
MAVERINSAADPRIAAYRDVRDGELLRSRGLFVAEGRFVVRRVIEDRRYRVESVLLNGAALKDLASTVATLARDVHVLVCDADTLAEITGYDVHRGCLALVHRPPATRADEVFESARTILILEGVSNADNVGGVFRNAAAFGAGGVLLSPTGCDPLYRKAIRTSMGASLSVPFARAGDGDWPGVLTRVRAAGFTIVALTLGDPAETLDAFAAGPRASRVALMVGTEGAGLTPAVEAEADSRVRIPINEDVDSLNVAVAVGIALYRLRRTGTA